MPTKLSTTVSKIHTIPNAVNTAIIEEFHKYMKDNDGLPLTIFYITSNTKSR
jgi:flagellar motor switch protein FliG